MKKISILFILVFVFLFASHSLYGQKMNGGFLTLELGFQKYKEIDQIISPLRYENRVFPVFVSMVWNREKFRHYLFSTFYSSELSAVSENSRSLFYLVLGYGYMRKVNSYSILGKQVQFSGGLERSNMMHLNQQRIDDFGVTLNNSGYFSSAINISGRADIRLSRRHLIFYVVKTPVAQYIVRPGYSLFRPNESSDKILDNLKEGEIEFLFYGSRFSQRLQYMFEISKGFYLATGIWYDVNSIPDPRSISSIQKGATLGTVIKL